MSSEQPIEKRDGCPHLLFQVFDEADETYEEEARERRSIWIEMIPSGYGAYLVAHSGKPEILPGGTLCTEDTAMAQIKLDYFNNRLQALLWDGDERGVNDTSHFVCPHGRDAADEPVVLVEDVQAWQPPRKEGALQP